MLRHPTGVVYLHADQLGSTGVATNSSRQSVVSRQEYDPWGKVRAGVGYSGISQTTVRYTGQKLDGTGLMYYHARYYDPNVGKFTSSDTIIPEPANPQAFNRYGYAYNNPLRYKDATGHCAGAADDGRIITVFPDKTRNNPVENNPFEIKLDKIHQVQELP